MQCKRLHWPIQVRQVGQEAGLCDPSDGRRFLLPGRCHVPHEDHGAAADGEGQTHQARPPPPCAHTRPPDEPENATRLPPPPNPTASRCGSRASSPPPRVVFYISGTSSASTRSSRLKLSSSKPTPNSTSSRPARFTSRLQTHDLLACPLHIPSLRTSSRQTQMHTLLAPSVTPSPRTLHTLSTHCRHTSAIRTPYMSSPLFVHIASLRTLSQHTISPHPPLSTHFQVELLLVELGICT